MPIMICEVRGAFRISLPAMLVREREAAFSDSFLNLHTSARDEEKRIVVTYHNGHRFVFVNKLIFRKTPQHFSSESLSYTRLRCRNWLLVFRRLLRIWVGISLLFRWGCSLRSGWLVCICLSPVGILFRWWIQNGILCRCAAWSSGEALQFRYLHTGGDVYSLRRWGHGRPIVMYPVL